MARDDLHFRLRIPDDLKSRLKGAAEENRRSMTAEIIARLEGTFDTEATRTPGDLKDFVRDIVREVLAAQQEASSKHGK